MGKVFEMIKDIQLKENLSLSQVFEKYPHLEELQKKELFDELQSKKNENKETGKQVLLG